MKIVANFWDKVLIVDDIFEPQFLKEYQSYLDNLGEKQLSYIQTIADAEVIYDDGTGVYESPIDWRESDYLKTILNCKFFPILEGHKIEHSIRLHTMGVGSLMNEHTDAGYSIAVTTYLSECVGGELFIKNPDNGETTTISPRINRTVFLKCYNVPHSVHEVTSGERVSIQTFIKYYR